MSLRRRTIAILFLAGLGLTAVVYGACQVFLLNRFAEMEQQATRAGAERVYDALSHELSSISALVAGEAARDDTYQFIAGRSPAYIKSNMTGESLAAHRIGFVVYLNADGETVFSRAMDQAVGRETPLPSSLQAHLRPGSRLLQPGRPRRVTQGVLLTDDQVVLIASRPVTGRDPDSPGRGFLLMGRYLDGQEIRRLSAEIGLPVQLHRLDRPGLPPDVERARGRLTATDPILAQPLSAQSVAGYVLVQDLYNRPALILRAESPRTIYRQGMLGTLHFLAYFIAAFGLGSILVVWLLDRYILGRVKRLIEDIQEVGAAGDLSLRVPVTGNDEVASLAASVNEMLGALERLEEAYRGEQEHRRLVDDLLAAHQQLTDIIEFLPDATFVVGRDRKVIAWNKAMEDLSGLSKEQMINQDTSAVALAFYGTRRRALLEYLFDAGALGLSPADVDRTKASLRRNVFLPQAFSGRGAQVEIAAAPLFDAQGRIAGAIESLREVGGPELPHSSVAQEEGLWPALRLRGLPEENGELVREIGEEELAFSLGGREVVSVRFSGREGLSEAFSLLQQEVEGLPITRDMSLRFRELTFATVSRVAGLIPPAREVRVSLVDNGDALWVVFETPPADCCPDPTYSRERARENFFRVYRSLEGEGVHALGERVLWHASDTQLTVMAEVGFRSSSSGQESVAGAPGGEDWP